MLTTKQYRGTEISHAKVLIYLYIYFYENTKNTNSTSIYPSNDDKSTMDVANR